MNKKIKIKFWVFEISISFLFKRIQSNENYKINSNGIEKEKNLNLLCNRKRKPKYPYDDNYQKYKTPTGKTLNYFKRGQGAAFSSIIDFDTTKQQLLKVGGALAVSKGSFTLTFFTAVILLPSIRVTLSTMRKG